MKKIFLLIALIITLSNFTYAQWSQCGDFNNGNIWGLVTIGNNIFAGTDYGVYESTDIGATWQTLNNGLTQLGVRSFVLNGNTMYVGTDSGAVFYSSDNGQKWNKVTNVYDSAIVYSFAFIGNNIFAGIYNKGVFLSTNNGTTWDSVNTGLGGTDITCLTTIGNNLFAGTSTEGVYISTNNGTKWNAANSGLVSNEVKTLSVSGKNLYVGTSGAGVYLSTDNGTSWNAINKGIPELYIWLVATNRNNIFVDTQYDGIFMSTNMGSNFTNITQGLITNITGMYYNILSFAFTDSYIFAGTPNGGGVFKALLSDFGINGVADNKDDSNIQMKITPNPASDNISISISNSDVSNFQISIFNSLGMEIMTQIPNISNFDNFIFYKIIYIYIMLTFGTLN